MHSTHLGPEEVLATLCSLQMAAEGHEQVPIAVAGHVVGRFSPQRVRLPEVPGAGGDGYFIQQKPNKELNVMVPPPGGLLKHGTDG